MLSEKQDCFRLPRKTYNHFELLTLQTSLKLFQEWSCDLQQKAIPVFNITCLTECRTDPPTAPNGTTGFFHWYDCSVSIR
ncbi:hypothetical protein ANCCAN_00654 [Ancylostoma caninum]|uniref:Uncharacterized protein n=1 Tax=Ancylostoma caninum TaxID=29170 RepID=A0A368H923_ANCCA|nr:hypothetical protein ANCCAN_00654 [Ancylostoma caninum]